MNNVFTYQSMPLPEFCRSPKGTVAIFLCPWDGVICASSRINSKFKTQSLDYTGKVELKSFNIQDPVTGESCKMIRATVIKPCPPLKKRGRKLGQKNKPKQ